MSAAVLWAAAVKTHLQEVAAEIHVREALSEGRQGCPRAGHRAYIFTSSRAVVSGPAEAVWCGLPSSCCSAKFRLKKWELLLLARGWQSTPVQLQGNVVLLADQPGDAGA